MKVLIVGGCGYIGSALYWNLQDQGYLVETVDLEKRGNPGIKGNEVAHMAHISRFDRYDAVIVMAGHSSVAAAVADPRGAFQNNLVNLELLSRRLSGQPLIFASSSAIYSAPRHQTNMYDMTKRAIDQMIPLLYPNSFALRFGTVAGRSPNLRNDTVVNAMVRSAVCEHRVIMSNPGVRRPILGMDDLVEGVNKILQGKVEPGAHNMCSWNMKIADIAAVVALRTGVAIERGPDSPTYDFTMEPAPWMDPPIYTLAEIVDNFACWWGEQ